MSRRQFLQIRFDVRFVARFCFPECVQEQIRNFGHCRDDNRDRTLLVLLSRQLRGDLNTLGGTHAGPAEFHDE